MGRSTEGATGRGEPRPLREMPAALCAGLAWLFTDIDDTLTTDGLLPASLLTKCQISEYENV